MFLFLSKASLQLYSDFSRKQIDKSHQITLKMLKNFFEKFLISLLTNLFFSGIILNVPLMRIQNARVAQLVERDLAKVEAAGSSPVSRFSYALISGLFCFKKESRLRDSPPAVGRFSDILLYRRSASSLRSGRRKAIVHRTMCALAELFLFHRV